jgi:adenylate cyclase
MMVMGEPVEALATIEPPADVRSGYRVVLSPVGKRLQAVVRGQIIADSAEALVMHETRLPSVFYFPRHDVRMDLLTRTSRRSHCPFKGDASYWTLNVDGATIANAAWSYEDPYDEATDVKEYVAFEWAAIDTWLADDAQIFEQPFDDGAAEANPFVGWLVHNAWRPKTLAESVKQLAEVLIDNGLPLWRLRIVIRTLNPQLFGMAYTWQRGVDAVDEYQVPHDTLNSPEYLNSPFALIIRGEGGVRRRLEGSAPRLDFPVLEDLREEGATDYVAMPLPFSDGLANIITLVSDAPGGFSTHDLGRVYEVLPSLGRHLEAHAQRISSLTLLTTYLGHSAGERVMGGLVKRGDGEELHAVIWFSDLRNSTQLADTLSRSDYLAALNQYFDAVAGTIIEHGGEVLKFIGDAVLAIFPIGDPTASGTATCKQALLAVREAQQQVHAVNVEREANGQLPLAFGTGLHRGNITYGNIGTSRRLDFTVIGPAVNEASRIEDLSKSLREPVLASAAFAECVPGELRSVGRHSLRGVRLEEEIYAPLPANNNRS